MNWGIIKIEDGTAAVEAPKGIPFAVAVANAYRPARRYEGPPKGYPEVLQEVDTPIAFACE